MDSLRNHSNSEERVSRRDANDANRPDNNSDRAEVTVTEKGARRRKPEGGMMEIPEAVRAYLRNPALMPNESPEQFHQIYSDFLEPLAPETIPEHWLVLNAAILTREVLFYRRMKVGFMLNQRRSAVSGLIRKSFPALAMRELRKPGSDIDANVERYFAEPDYAALVDKALPKSGYSLDAVESEVFTRSLSGLSQIERLISSAEKRLTLFFREMDRIHDVRALRAKTISTRMLSSEGQENGL